MYTLCICPDTRVSTHYSVYLLCIAVYCTCRIWHIYVHLYQAWCILFTINMEQNRREGDGTGEGLNHTQLQSYSSVTRRTKMSRTTSITTNETRGVSRVRVMQDARAPSTSYSLSNCGCAFVLFHVLVRDHVRDHVLVHHALPERSHRLHQSC